MNSIRWASSKYRPAILEIDALSFARPWDEAELITHLRQRDTICMVLAPDEVVRGFMVYELRQRRRLIKVHRFAVHPDYRLRGCGRRMLIHLEAKLAHQYRTAIVDIPGSMLAAHLWLRACGWKAVPLAGCDEYRFSFAAKERDECGKVAV